eukprot:ctg_366.g216
MPFTPTRTLECLSGSPDDLGHHPGADRLVALAHRKAQALLQCDRRNELHGAAHVIARHAHLHIGRQLERAGNVGGAHEKLRPIVAEEGRVPTALLLGQHVQLGLKLAIRLDGARFGQHLPAHHLLAFGTSQQTPDVLAGLAMRQRLAKRLHPGDRRAQRRRVAVPQPDHLHVVARPYHAGLHAPGHHRAPSGDAKAVLNGHQERLVHFAFGDRHAVEHLQQLVDGAVTELATIALQRLERRPAHHPPDPTAPRPPPCRICSGTPRNWARPPAVTTARAPASAAADRPHRSPPGWRHVRIAARRRLVVQVRRVDGDAARSLLRRLVDLVVRGELGTAALRQHLGDRRRNVVLPWSTCPIPPTFKCGLRADAAAASASADNHRRRSDRRDGAPGAVARAPWSGDECNPHGEASAAAAVSAEKRTPGRAHSRAQRDNTAALIGPSTGCARTRAAETPVGGGGPEAGRAAEGDGRSSRSLRVDHRGVVVNANEVHETRSGSRVAVVAVGGGGFLWRSGDGGGAEPDRCGADVDTKRPAERERHCGIGEERVTGHPCDQRQLASNPSLPWHVACLDDAFSSDGVGHAAAGAARVGRARSVARLDRCGVDGGAGHGFALWAVRVDYAMGAAAVAGARRERTSGVGGAGYRGGGPVRGGDDSFAARTGTHVDASARWHAVGHAATCGALRRRVSGVVDRAGGDAVARCAVLGDLLGCVRGAATAAEHWMAMATPPRVDHEHGAVRGAVHFTAGVGAGMAAALFTTPADVVKTRSQARHGMPSTKPLAAGQAIQGARAASTAASPIPPFWTALRRLFADEGAAGLFRGLTPRIIKVIPASGLMMVTFEEVKRWFRQQRRLQDAPSSHEAFSTDECTPSVMNGVSACPRA